MNHRALGVIGILGLGSLAGCGGDAPTEGAAGTSAGAASLPRHADAAQPTSVAAVPLGTATVPVRLGFMIAERPEPGRETPLLLTLSGSEDLDRVEVSISSTALAVAPDQASFVIAPLRAGQIAEHPVRITPKSAGLADLELQVKVTSASGEREARFAVPILAEVPAP